jgi:hypothetical protein
MTGRPLSLMLLRSIPRLVKAYKDIENREYLEILAGSNVYLRHARSMSLAETGMKMVGLIAATALQVMVWHAGA